jgi:hypothetical protein
MPTIKGFKGGLFPGKGKKPAALRPSEALVQNSIRDFLNMLGIYNDRLNSGQVNVVTRYTTKAGVDKEYSKWVHLCKKGTPDLFFIFSGRMHLVETKRVGNKATPDQLARHKELRRAGAVVWEADSLEKFAALFYEKYPQLKNILLS